MKRRIGLVAALAVVGLFATVANATMYGWDFNTKDPDDASYWPYNMLREGSGYGQGAGLLGDGTAEFKDASSTENNAFYAAGWTGGYTVDMRLKVLETVNEAAGKSMSVREASGAGRGIKLRTDGIELVSGGGVVRGYGIDMTVFQTIRFSLPNDGLVYHYLWDAGSGSWTDLGAQELGGSGYGGQPAGGVAIGSWAGGSTQSGKFVIDWAYVDNEVARQGAPPPMPEPASLALLVLGAASLLRRRR